MTNTLQCSHRRSFRIATPVLRRAIVAAAFAIGGTAPLAVQSAASSTTASPPHERLAVLEGTWWVAELPAERGFRERCAWLEGARRHMVCRSRSRNAAGEWREGLSMFSESIHYVPAPAEEQ